MRARARVPDRPKGNRASIPKPRHGDLPSVRSRGPGPGGNAKSPGDDDSGTREKLSFLGKVARSTLTAESRRAEKRWAVWPKSDVRVGRRPVPPSSRVKIQANAVESRASAYQSTAADLRGE